MSTVYIRNELGGIQSVTQEHYDKHLTTRTNDGGRFPLPGITVLSEADAREANPQLFGVHDPQVVFTDDELARKLQRQKQLRELYAEEEQLAKGRSRRGRAKAAPAPAESEGTDTEGAEPDTDDEE